MNSEIYEWNIVSVKLKNKRHDAIILKVDNEKELCVVNLIVKDFPSETVRFVDIEHISVTQRYYQRFNTLVKKLQSFCKLPKLKTEK